MSTSRSRWVGFMTLVSGGTKGPRTGDDGGVSTELLMEGEELQLCDKFLQSDTKFTLWIIEYVWAHKMIDTLEGWFTFL